MKRTIRHLILYILIAEIGSGVPGLRVTAFASTDLQPSWSKEAILGNINSSYLSDKQYVRSSSLKDQILDNNSLVEMRQQYQDMVRSYEIRERYGLVELEERRNHDNELSSFTTGVLKRVRSYHYKRNLKTLRKAAERDPILSKAMKPAALLAAIYAVYNGEPLKFRLSDQSLLTASANAPAQRGSVALDSPLLRTSIDFSAPAPSSRDPFSSDPVDPRRAGERYRISVSRNVPIVDLSTGVSYGTTTSTVTASVGRQLTDHLSCVFDTSKSVHYNRPGSGKKGEESLRLMYGINF